MPLMELAAIAASAAFAWHWFSAGVSIGIIALALVAGAHLWLAVRAGAGDRARAGVLASVAALSEAGVPETRALGLAIARLDPSRPDPEGTGDRAGLADALRLEGAERAMLVEGDLARACAQLAAAGRSQAERGAKRVLHAARLAGAALFAIALALLVRSERPATAGKEMKQAAAAPAPGMPRPARSAAPSRPPESPMPVPAPVPSQPGKPAAAGLTLIGVVGRLPHDAQVLVRPAWGKTTTLRVGDSLLGWTLIGIAPDRATFGRAGERIELRIKPS